MDLGTIVLNPCIDIFSRLLSWSIVIYGITITLKSIFIFSFLIWIGFYIARRLN